MVLDLEKQGQFANLANVVLFDFFRELPLNHWQKFEQIVQEIEDLSFGHRNVLYSIVLDVASNVRDEIFTVNIAKRSENVEDILKIEL